LLLTVRAKSGWNMTGTLSTWEERVKDTKHKNVRRNTPCPKIQKCQEIEGKMRTTQKQADPSETHNGLAQN
jgi:hypothetical protein